ncbi:Eco57I restriction-modification methylase domain-containing protein [Cystobacter fuscus]|nr:hypothetical protein [Cystobacter fuscus]
MSLRGHALERRTVAELGNAVVLEVRSRGGLFPGARERELAYKELAKRHPEHLVVFVDGRRTKSLWWWARREQRTDPRTHVHLRGQPGGRLVEKVALLHDALGGQGRGQDEALAEVARGLREAMDTRPLISRLTQDLQHYHELLLRQHQVSDPSAWLLLQRMILLAFLRGKGLRAGSTEPPNPFLEVREGQSAYLSDRQMKALLFEGSAQDEEEARPEFDLTAETLHALFQFVERYSWSLEAVPAWEGDVTPDVVEECFARAVRSRHAGAVRPPPEVSRYLCEQAVHPVILDAIRRLTGIRFDRFDDLLLDLDTAVCRRLLHEVLPGLRLLDPSCGTGTRLKEALETLAAVHLAILHRIEAEEDEGLLAEVAPWRQAPGGPDYFIRKRILLRNLFGVDEDAVSVEVARSHLLLGLLSAAKRNARSNPLPSLEFNLLSGNALVGLTDTANERSQWVTQTVRPLLESYRASEEHRGPEALRDWIRGFRQKASEQLNDLLLEELWPHRTKRPLGREDIAALRPIHWCLDFGDVLEEHGGFDAILTIPPWEVLSGPGPVNDLLRRAHPHSTEGWGRAALYKFFIERAFHLLRPGGQAAMVVPSSFYSEQGSSGLRQWLLEQGAPRVVLGLSNEYHLFDEVHRSFKFCILAFGKDSPSESFEVAFRVDPREAIQREELDAFLHDSASRLTLTEELVRRLSPASLSIPELRSRDDLVISEKLMRFPSLATPGTPTERLALKIGPSRHRLRDVCQSHPGPRGLPLCGGRTIQQYGWDTSSVSFWVDEEKAHARLPLPEFAGERAYRLALRTIATSANRRTLIATVLPPHVLCDQSVMWENPAALVSWERFFLVALFNSFVLDYLVRQRLGGANILRSVLMTLPIPQLDASEARLLSVARRAARLICTTPDFDEAARDVGLRGHRDGAVEQVERMRLQAELEGLVAHLYTLEEVEFAHILSTFPLVPAAQRTAARNAYRDVTHGVIE